MILCEQILLAPHHLVPTVMAQLKFSKSKKHLCVCHIPSYCGHVCQSPTLSCSFVNLEKKKSLMVECYRWLSYVMSGACLTRDLKCVSVRVTVRESVVRAGESGAVVCDRFMARGPEL